jgi:hypothetical protein
VKTLVSLSLPAGSYVIHATTTLQNQSTGSIFIQCGIETPVSSGIPRTDITPAIDQEARLPIALTSAGTLVSPMSVLLVCSGPSQSSFLAFRPRMAATRVGSVTTQ